MKFCIECGTPMREDDRVCDACGFDFATLPGSGRHLAQENISERSFAVAAVLCGIFGIFGVHHFYLGNHLHGLFDLGLVVLAVILMMVPPFGPALAAAVIAIDVLHSLVVMIRLFIGKTRDGRGRVVAFPGQRL